MFENAEHINVAILFNRGCWVFDMDNRKDIAFLDLHRTSKPQTTVSFQGPFKSRAEWDKNIQMKAITASGDEVLSWNDSASFHFFRLLDPWRFSFN